ncbi:WYL domain-containing protein [Grimontia hollisae]|uniref:Uncharacterized protein n=1 Tax=Grimontia hollisae TaxID=673 RepID=A0A377J8C3_GRIHO|nr:WYL domain-containing protein [Grimontia hollisae]STO98952.1 Uncharacterised protein [Grimontia hollisae]STR61829.1 Uncharacterised protein [Grimontia hollisae]
MRTLEDLPKNVTQRIEFIEFSLVAKGWVSRADLIDMFDISAPVATRDFKQYRELAEANMVFNESLRRYELNESYFKPLFTLTSRKVLSRLRSPSYQKIVNVKSTEDFGMPPRLGYPKVEVLMPITRAINNDKAIEIEYLSVKNGFSKKIIAPQAIFDSGLKWYVRTWDYQKGKFIDLLISRIKSVCNVDTELFDTTVKEVDHQWNREIKLCLSPHPKNVENSQTLEYEMDMVNGEKEVKVKAATAGYWLRLWNVDCTEDHSLRGHEYQLWLKNHQILFDVESATIAPGR